MRITLVIPCFNEERRLDRNEVRALLRGVGPAGDKPRLRSEDDAGERRLRSEDDAGERRLRSEHDDTELSLILVDDGSTDGSLAMLHDIARDEPRVRVLPLGKNQGKAEAVRHGLNLAALDADVVGYVDADFATPATEMLRIVAALRDDENIDVALGSRVALLGKHIERRAIRHYLGRVFATAASQALRVAVYDTQCGAKAFRVTPPLRRALVKPFLSRWAFDVELLSRLLDEGVSVRAIVEVPLDVWRDVDGSKVTPLAIPKAALDLARIARARRRR